MIYLLECFAAKYNSRVCRLSNDVLPENAVCPVAELQAARGTASCVLYSWVFAAAKEAGYTALCKRSRTGTGAHASDVGRRVGGLV